MRPLWENLADAYGNALKDCLTGKAHHYVIEREDGYISVGNLDHYFTPYEQWGEIEQRMPEFVRGRVLDVGCGAGRHSLHLQNLGHEIMAIDKSPLAVQVAMHRGVKQAIAISVDDFAKEFDLKVGPFDTIIMMGHNIGLLHNFLTAQKILEYFGRIAPQGARIIGTTRDVSDTQELCHLTYQEENLRRGRMRGQIRLRIRHEMFESEWLDYLFVSEKDLRKLIQDTCWRLETTIYGESGFRGTSYLAVLCKE